MVEPAAKSPLRRLAIVIGTRPEAIKLAPVVLEAERSGQFDVQVIRTSQHREMLDQMVDLFELKIDVDLDIMKPDQSLADVTTNALSGLYETFSRLKPDCVVVQGDTTTTFVGALAAFYLQIPVAHVEAGLRTFDKRQPYPEEINRCLTSQLTDLHFPPTARAQQNLLKEGIADDRIWVTGNTAIDALFYTLEKEGRSATTAPVEPRTILLTAHRRENHGEGMERICEAVLELVQRYDDLRVVYPVHMSPRVRRTVHARLGDHPRVQLIEPLDYREFVLAMSEATLILTDSGGVQEEAPSLGKPVLILREVTERPEASEAGVALPVGTDRERIVREASRLLDDAEHYRRMSETMNPYGDGKAAGRILAAIGQHIPVRREG